MTIVAVGTVPGSGGATTTAVLLGALAPAAGPVVVAECDPSGGDIAAWAERATAPGWSTAVAASDRTVTGLAGHTQRLPSGLPVLFAPARTGEAQLVTSEAARGFAAPVRDAPDVVVVADCGRIVDAIPPWAVAAQLTLIVLRQVAQSAAATVAVVDRAGELLEVIRGTVPRVGVVLVGGAPYRAAEIERALGIPLFGALPDDRAGAALVAGGWTLGQRAATRTPLARAAAELSRRVIGSLPAVAVGSAVG